MAQEVQQIEVLTRTIPFSKAYSEVHYSWPRNDQSSGGDNRNRALDEQRLESSTFGWEDMSRALEKQELESLRQVGQIFHRSRKRKLLIWLTGYFPINVANRELTYANYAIPYGTRRKMQPDMTPLYQTAVDSLNDARLSIFPVPYTYGKGSLDGLTELAQRTGGKMLGVLDRIDFFNTIASLRKNFDSYYVLSFTLQSARKDSWIDSNVKVNKGDVKVIAMRGFFAEQ